MPLLLASTRLCDQSPSLVALRKPQEEPFLLHLLCRILVLGVDGVACMSWESWGILHGAVVLQLRDENAGGGASHLSAEGESFRLGDSVVGEDQRVLCL